MIVNNEKNKVYNYFAPQKCSNCFAEYTLKKIDNGEILCVCCGIYHPEKDMRGKATYDKNKGGQEIYGASPKKRYCKHCYKRKLGVKGLKGKLN